MHRVRNALAVVFLVLLAGPVTAAPPAVVVSIKPLNSLVAAVMQGVGVPYLIVKGAASPHTYALKPSDATALQKADIVFRDSRNLENFLNATLATLPTSAKVIALAEAPGVEPLTLRATGTFELDTDAVPAPDNPGAKVDASKVLDPHTWMDPLNAKAMVATIAEALSTADPENADTYRANAIGEARKLDALVAELEPKLAPLKGRQYIVFHDAYHYFERRFGLTAAGSIVVDPGTPPGVRRIAEIRAKIKSLGTTCVFSEPEFPPKLVDVIIEGTSAKKGVLDPLGADLPDGPDLYFTLIHNVADGLIKCLG